jgi:hypothetical protein
MILKTLEEMGWSRVMDYGRRWSVETSFSTFKHMENTVWLNMENISRRCG